MIEKETVYGVGTYATNYGISLNNCPLLGEGHHGRVYLIANDRVIKICKDSKSCIYEAFILQRVNGNPYFPQIYDYDEHYIIRDYVEGITLAKYIKAHGLNEAVSLKVLNLLQEFIRLGFTKIDIRCRDILVQENLEIMVIDPKGSFTRKIAYPRHLMKGLNKLGVLDTFLAYVKEHCQNLYEEWEEQKEIRLNRKGASQNSNKKPHA